MLADLDAVEGATVADLFAGTGAMGIEALSRGASAATFVDDDPAAVRVIGANLAATGLSGPATVVRQEVGRWLAGAPAVDLALVDPPYRYTGWPRLLERLRAGLAVLESARELEVGGDWRLLKVKHYRSTVVTLVQPMKGRL